MFSEQLPSNFKADAEQGTSRATKKDYPRKKINRWQQNKIVAAASRYCHAHMEAVQYMPGGTFNLSMGQVKLQSRYKSPNSNEEARASDFPTSSWNKRLCKRKAPTSTIAVTHNLHCGCGSCTVWLADAELHHLVGGRCDFVLQKQSRHAPNLAGSVPRWLDYWQS